MGGCGCRVARDNCRRTANKRHHGNPDSGHDVLIGRRCCRADIAVPQQRGIAESLCHLDDGALGDVTSGQLLILVPSVFAGLLLAVLTIKPLNLLLFGEEYAVTMGLNIRRSRSLLFLSTTLLAGTITAFCGPIGFIGLAMPHVTRMLFQNSDHHVLLPGTILSGASILLLCDIISKIFTLPINAITALLGIPIVVWVVLRNKSITA